MFFPIDLKPPEMAVFAVLGLFFAAAVVEWRKEIEASIEVSKLNFKF